VGNPARSQQGEIDMSMYGMIFGQNPLSDVLLATLGLTKSDVGNRKCWCESNPKYGHEKCQHRVVQEEVDEMLLVDKDEVEKYPQQYSVFVGAQRLVGTGKRVIQDYYFCEQPNSIECACPGCTISYRLPNHPNYISDCDDDFDYTYATAFFSFPDEFADGLAKIDAGEEFDPDDRWANAIAALKSA
jgi:hypothetical protein